MGGKWNHANASAYGCSGNNGCLFHCGKTNSSCSASAANTCGPVSALRLVVVSGSWVLELKSE